MMMSTALFKMITMIVRIITIMMMITMMFMVMMIMRMNLGVRVDEVYAENLGKCDKVLEK